MFLRLFKKKQPGVPALDSLYYRLYNRETRLKRFVELNAPQVLIDKENELVARAKSDIEVRHASIKKRVASDRQALALALMEDAKR